MKEFFNKIILFFTCERYTEVYQVTGTWTINYIDGLKGITKFCEFVIHKSNKGRYKMTYSGYNPRDHHLYAAVFKYCRCLNEGIYYVVGGELFKYDEHLTLEECNEKLAKALEDENYELAEKIRKIIANKQ